MKLVNLTIQEIVNKCRRGGRIFCIGAGHAFYTFEQSFRMMGIDDNIVGIADNNSVRWGTYIKIENGRKIAIISVQEMVKRIKQQDTIVVTTLYLSEIMQQLEKFPLENEVAFYGFLIDNYCDEMLQSGDMNAAIVQDEQFSIPKVIHYCWFGRGRIPDRYRAWMETWKKYCPDYEIVEWNEDNYDITKNDYMMQAYEAKRWGFVPDYARLDIIYQYGGIYLDTDVEVLQPLDTLLHQEAFAGFQEATGTNVGLGLGSVPLNPLVKEMRDDYDNLSFVNEDGSLNLMASPYYQTKVLLKYGLKRNGRFQKLPHLNLYPKVFFSPMNHYNRVIRKNENSYLLHHFDGSWVEGRPKNAWDKLPDIYGA